jgi:protein-disulfide isomerase
MVKKISPKEIGKNLKDKMWPTLIIVTYIMAFAIGILWEKVNNLQGGTVNTSKATPTTSAAAAAGQPTAAPAASISQIKSLFSADLVKFGDANRKVLFVDVSDPSCPYCQISGGKNPELNNQAGDRFKLVADGGTYVAPVPEMRKLVDQGKASYVYLYTPGHGAGEMGARALYCAFEKGKYWEVHDLLFTNNGYNLMNNTVKNDKTKAGDLADFLKSAVSASDMKTCLESTKYDQRLQSDSATAQSLGVSGTPGFYVNATIFKGAYSYKDMEPVVTTALK